MKPVDFVLFANTLLANPGEVAQRSAVSRGYYGAFNAAKALIESCGVRFPESAETHEKLSWCLDESGDLEMSVASGKLRSLRQIRNSADYEMDDRRFIQAKFVASQVRIARDIFDAVSSAETRTEAFRGQVREYARTVGMSLRKDE